MDDDLEAMEAGATKKRKSDEALNLETTSQQGDDDSKGGWLVRLVLMI